MNSVFKQEGHSSSRKMSEGENECSSDCHDVIGSVNGFVFKYYKKTVVIWTKEESVRMSESLSF